MRAWLEIEKDVEVLSIYVEFKNAIYIFRPCDSGIKHCSDNSSWRLNKHDTFFNRIRRARRVRKF